MIIENQHLLSDNGHKVEIIASTWQGHWEPSHTSWGWTEIKKWSGWLYRIIKNHYIHPDDGPRLGNGQVNLTGSLTTTTYKLRLDRDWQMVSSTCQNHWWSPHTSWGWSEIWEWSGQLNRIIENHHIHPKDGQGLGKHQVNLSTSLRTIIYFLIMDRDREMVRSIRRDHWEQSHTSWGWTAIGKWSSQLGRII